jgi:hypothetical protein
LVKDSTTYGEAELSNRPGEGQSVAFGKGLSRRFVGSGVSESGGRNHSPAQGDGVIHKLPLEVCRAHDIDLGEVRERAHTDGYWTCCRIVVERARR